MPHLKVAVSALFHSTSFPFKLILIESESTDGTAEYCDEMAKSDRIEVYHTPKKGYQNALNFGIKKAADLDVYITQDDVIHSRLYGRDWLKDMNGLSKRENVGQVTTIAGHGKSGPQYLEGLIWAGSWSMYLSRRTINEVGLFDENMMTGDDIDYSYRCSKKGKVVVLIDYWVQHHRFTGHGIVDDPKTIAKMAKYFRQKHKLRCKDE